MVKNPPANEVDLKLVMFINFKNYTKNNAVTERWPSSLQKELSTSIKILPALCNFCSYGTLTIRVLLCSFQST